ncbi:hypothetical protein Ppa06_28700 [Planomonospora parontospora subsp. parontospora]|uniref:Uncharacterized protein n=2 Tax=Planomonospora parontospora TaxID=58119 RepID=A0AA37F4R3_9ACTN|nr:hypothetical protein [Planomonospora parontospora]GGK68144.1 hypothetical protein GCM10010126_29460 [Planomonospora parontospora]GII09072.1 hypothetical protein Ppa06_28700 [Planomonospora parontospora subsp. parontospora]
MNLPHLRAGSRTNLRTRTRTDLHAASPAGPSTRTRTASSTRTGRITAPAAAVLAVLALPAVLAGCGISPTGVRDSGRPPVISYSPTWVTVYMVDDGTLQPVRVPVASDSTENVVKSLFRAGQQPPRPGLTSELTGFDYYDIKTTRYTGPSQRSEPTDDLGYRLNVIVTGEGRVTRLGLAQITCTVRQNKQASIWSVEITRLFPGTPESLGEHSCSEYKDLAGRGVRLPP